MKLVITTPEDFTGNITGNICSKRGKILDINAQNNAKIITSLVPLANLFGYSSELRNMTQGRAYFSMEFEKYDSVPLSLAETIVEEHKKKELEKSKK